MATGSIKKDDVELTIENLLKEKFGPETVVEAEKFSGDTDAWKITVDPQGRYPVGS